MEAHTSDPNAEAQSSSIALDPAVNSTIEVLVVDDERTLRESCASILRAEGFKVHVEGKGEEAQETLKRRRFDIILLDLYMSGVPGMDILATALERAPECLVVVMTGNPSVESSIHALRAGAWTYIPKPFSATHLRLLIGRAAHAVTVARESQVQQEQVRQESGHSEKITLLGKSAAFTRVVELARKVARTDASVFITGESGTGKELVAQFIHHHSRRMSRELVPINCAAMPESLLESEMFGHVEGAFTGAVREKRGLLEVANGGTLFLDELTEMPLSVQAKLLRVVQDGVVRRVGSTKTDAVVDVRFIAATNRDPADAVKDNALRRDLHYRLRVVPIHVPPLRSRPEDIPVLAGHFLRQFWREHRSGDGPAPAFSDEATQALIRCPWRGNVRELRNVVEHTVVLLDPGAEVQADDIPFIDEDETFPVPATTLHGADVFDQNYHDARDQVLAQFERGYLEHVVRKAGGNISDAARIAGVDRTTLYRLMEKHGTEREELLSTSGD